MKPTIGRTVHYCTDNVPGAENPNAIRAAIITEVGEEHVGLMVFEPTSVTTARHVPYSEEYSRGCWSWPPREDTPAPVADTTAPEAAPKRARAPRAAKASEAPTEQTADTTAPEAGGEGTAEQ